MMRAEGWARLYWLTKADNTPARRLYASLEFIETDVRDVYLHFLPTQAAG